MSGCSRKASSSESLSNGRTVDPERDTPEVLKEYAQAFGANLAGWSFLT
jgi:hypothetical protein